MYGMPHQPQLVKAVDVVQVDDNGAALQLDGMQLEPLLVLLQYSSRRTSHILYEVHQ